MTVNKDYDFIQGKIDEVDSLTRTLRIQIETISSSTYDNAYLLILENKRNHDFYSKYIYKGFIEVFGIGMMRGLTHIYFSCETPNGKAVLIQAELKR